MIHHLRRVPRPGALACLPALVLAGALSLSACSPASPAPTGREAEDVPDHGDAPAEIARIGEHLAGVEEELRSRDVSHLDEAARAARLETLSWLREYREAGRYPHNHVLPAARTPVFVDPHGTPCAVGYLLLRSGEDELVERVASTDNLVRIPELAGDAVLEAWLDRRGLTLAEAARIQPAYDGERTRTLESNAYDGGTAALALVSTGLQAWGLSSSPPDGGLDAIGVLALGAATGHGVLTWARATERVDGATWALALNGVFAVADVVLGVHRFRDLQGDRASPGEVTVGPTFASRDGRPAVGVRLGF